MKTVPLMAVCTLTAFAASTPPAQSLASLTWLGGCWERRNGSRVVEEHWMTPRGVVMLGMSRTTRGDSTAEFEQTRIEQRRDGIFFIARPSRQREAEFRAVEVSDSAFVVENPTHDFPQRIIYRKYRTDSLKARVEGTMNGAARAIDFPYARVACAR